MEIVQTAAVPGAEAAVPGEPAAPGQAQCARVGAAPGH
jgi:hypothetical protein